MPTIDRQFNRFMVSFRAGKIFLVNLFATFLLTAVLATFIFAWVVPVYQIKDWPYDTERITP